ncbi:hypothetical protein OHA72_33610 [Dactylosporangium sp. NBC_01737]|uniref:hypothetical protein n=1 Tax=Dactylosporangium sp. NBC_01737 TaxID=2975959 RepID=UPI002E115763|nr:hypothetical protein OHA72_33610 [Dactylosporangium sp. NBC_01737]
MDRTAGYADSWHRQPVPPPLDRGSTSAESAIVAAVWLMADWTRDGTPGWRSECVIGTAPERNVQPWSQPPSPSDVAAIGGFDAEPDSASVLTALVQPGPNRPYEHTRPPAEVAAELVTLLSDRIPATDPRGQALLAHLAELLTGPYTDLLRVWTGGDELHLVLRDSSGRTLRLTVAPAPATEPPPALGDDGALRTRLACVITLLSTQLWVNNNNPVTFRVWLGPREDADPSAAAAGWWTRTREEPPDEAPELRPLTAEELDDGLYTIVRSSLLDLFDGSWSGVEEWPHVPPGHLTRHLYRDLLDLLLARTGGPDAPPQLLCTGYLPTQDMDDDLDSEDDYYGTVLFVGPAEVAVLDLDLTC